ncbi:hypothetical protein [Natronococcus jeotgali]|uniref:DUF2382 domain-containing protein n=1 Tax=Natronococcus jeotgali DSM 18795 TaxID=1227498 RepID=L9WTU7_9EURY|nr:hypothetical protein [Natronococcus jeotgali]ELY52847.1 hypothetical protein C492_18730 [Natronococcus jeotgali DSM 18795]
MTDETISGGSERRRMTTDPDRIREWAESRDAVPVSTHGGEGHGYSFARRGELDADEDASDAWAEFDEHLRDGELVFLYRGGSTGDPGELEEFELLEREAALERASEERSELEDALRRGETVTTEVVESDVEGESRVVERDTVESEVVDREVVDRELIESELLERTVVDTEFVGDGAVAVTTAESRVETIEEVERYAVESEVVGVDVAREEPRVEPDADADPESVPRSVLEDVARSDAAAESVDRELRNEAVDGAGDLVRSELFERRTVEERVEERVRRRFALEDTEVLDSDVLDSDVLDGELVDPEEYGTAEPSAEGAETTATAEPVPGTEPIVRELEDDDAGKAVVDDAGERIGIVTAVEGDTAYVDPEPGLTDRIKARLGWLERDDDDRSVRRSQVGEITDDELVLRRELEDG